MKILLLISFFTFTNFVKGQFFSLKNNRFNLAILNQKGGIKHIQSSSNQVYLDSLNLKKDQVQEMIKTPNTSYILTRGTGLVFKQWAKNDSSTYFVKTDSTQFDGYNFDDIKFEYRDTLFSIGGFGFWRNNGQVRYFTENKEWELLFAELPFGLSNRNFWNIDLENGVFYSIVKSDKEAYQLIIIHLGNKSWSQIELPAIFYDNLIFKNEFPIQIQLNKESGAILCYSNEIYFIDLKSQKLKKAINNKLLNFFNKNKIRESTVYQANDSIYIYNPFTKERDSIFYNQKDFIEIEDNVFKYSKMIIGLFVFFIAFALFILKVYLVKKKNHSKINFNEFEIEFIKQLCHKKGKYLDIEALNYLLGLSKKSLEIQKKNRSEFLNKLNQKLKEILLTDENIIIRVKDENDKRVFVYQINESYFDKVQNFI